MNTVFRFAIVALLIASSAVPASAKRKARHAPTPGKADFEAATRLQVFLDRANFSPGKIDGRYNEVTRKALALYRESLGEQPQTAPPQSKAKSNVASDVTGLDLANINPVDYLQVIVVFSGTGAAATFCVAALMLAFWRRATVAGRQP